MTKRTFLIIEIILFGLLNLFVEEFTQNRYVERGITIAFYAVLIIFIFNYQAQKKAISSIKLEIY